MPQRTRSITLKEKREGLLALTQFVECGRVRPVIGRTYSLGEAPAALADFAAGHARGKLVLAVWAAGAGRGAKWRPPRLPGV